MEAFTRLTLAGRALSLASLFLLAALTRDATSWQTVIAVTVVAGIGAYASKRAPLAVQWPLAGEAVVVSVIVALSMPESLVALPYLVVLALLGGFAAGIVGAGLLIAVQLIPLLSMAMVGGATSDTRTAILVIAPWCLTIISAGLLGAWVSTMGHTSTPGDENYQVAHRLVVQLREIADRLSSGLDPRSVADDLLATLQAAFHVKTAAVVTRSDAGVMLPLAFCGQDVDRLLHLEQNGLLALWNDATSPSQTSPSHWRRIAGSGDASAVVFKVGSVVVAAAVVWHPAPPNIPRSIQDALDAHAVRLETALVFDDIQELVTIDERMRLAREIHDGVAQELASLGYLIDDMRSSAVGTDLESPLTNLRTEVTRAVTELRLSIFDLRSGVNQSAGLGAALSDYVRNVGTSSPMAVHLSLDERPSRLAARTEAEIFRIAQEAITNARKHSAAKNLWIELLVRPPGARLLVRDDGKGLGRTLSKDSYGLMVMQERAQRIGAECRVKDLSAHGREAGTLVEVTIPENPGERLPAELRLHTSMG